MGEQSIQSDDMTLKRVFQDFYRVPDYQREYVWGETDPKGERGDEVEQFLKDIQREFEAATKDSAPEYFIGSVVVCPGADDVFDLIDGQQRATTAFLILCAIRDLLNEKGVNLPDDLPGHRSKHSSFRIKPDWTRGVLPIALQVIGNGEVRLLRADIDACLNGRLRTMR